MDTTTLAVDTVPQLDRFFQGPAGAGAASALPAMPEGQPLGAAGRSGGASPARFAAESPSRHGAAAGNPFGGGSPTHRRAASLASSHQRTLSGASDGAYGSMPGTPSHIAGPERSVVAAFAAEMEGELSVDPGDVVKVHSEVGGWARVLRVSDRRGGLVPTWAVAAAE
jgi:hypothetical protein